MTKDSKFTRAWFNHNYARIEKLCSGDPALAEWLLEDFRAKKVQYCSMSKGWTEGPYMRFGAIVHLLEVYREYGPCYTPAFRSFLARNRWVKHRWERVNIKRQAQEAA